MPRKRSDKPSAPTMSKWLKVYRMNLKEMVEEGRLTKPHAIRVARGLNAAIAALDESLVEYRKTQVKDFKERDAEAVEFFADA